MRYSCGQTETLFVVIVNVESSFVEQGYYLFVWIHIKNSYGINNLQNIPKSSFSAWTFESGTIAWIF